MTVPVTGLHSRPTVDVAAAKETGAALRRHRLRMAGTCGVAIPVLIPMADGSAVSAASRRPSVKVSRLASGLCHVIGKDPGRAIVGAICPELVRWMTCWADASALAA